MPRSGGTYTRTNGVHTGATVWQQDESAGTDILAARMDAHDQDVADALTASLAKDGQTTATGNMNWGGYRQTSVGDATAHTDAPNAGQVQDQAFTWCGTAGGTKNALTLTPSPAITAYAAGQSFTAIIGGTSSDDAVTVAVSGLTTKAVEIDGSALSASVVLESGKIYRFDYDGTAFQATRLSLDVSSFLTSSDIGSTVQGYDADTLKADTADVLTAGFAGTPYSAGTKSSGTYTPDEADGNLQYAVNGGAHTLAPPTNNSTIIIQYTNNSSAGTITTSGFTLVDGDTISTTDGDDFFFFITKNNGFSHLHVKALQ